MPQASARHLLVDSEEVCLELKKEIEGGVTSQKLLKLIHFAHLAHKVENLVLLAQVKWLKNLTKLFSTAKLVKFLAQLRLSSVTTY